MRRTAALALVVSFAALAPARRALADPPQPSEGARADEPDVSLALLSGVATALLPITLGGIRAASAPVGNDGARNVGLMAAGVGPALSPLVAHAVLGEWTRAAAFGAVPVASEIAVCALLTAQPDAVFEGTVGSRTLFALLYSAEILGTAVSLVDVTMAPERARRRRGSGITLTPSFGHGHAGVVLGGPL